MYSPKHSLTPSSSFPPIKYLQTLLRFHRAFSSPSGAVPALSAFPRMKDAPATQSSLWHRAGLTPYLFCTEEPRTGPSTPVVALQMLNREEGSPPITCWELTWNYHIFTQVWIIELIYWHYFGFKGSSSLWYTALHCATTVFFLLFILNWLLVTRWRGEFAFEPPEIAHREWCNSRTDTRCATKRFLHIPLPVCSVSEQGSEMGLGTVGN